MEELLKQIESLVDSGSYLISLYVALAILDIKIFCTDVVASARVWLQSVKDNRNFINNYEYFMKRHENGVPSYIVGIPVIG